LQDAAYVAWLTPRVHGLNQFRLTDGRIGGKGPLAYREFQSGLYFANGKPKPSARTFANPIVVRPAGSRLLVWGQARPGASHSVAIERRPPGAKAFARIAIVKTDARGYFQRQIARRSGQYRYRWADSGAYGVSEGVAIRR
jgi:hypothetical protein